MRKQGDRVGAVSHQEEGRQGTLFMFGYGVYEGDFPPAEAVGQMAEIGRDALGEKYVNPRIRLDSGKVVYGCECWWGSEGKVKEMEVAARAAGAKVVVLDIDEVRRKYREKEGMADGK